MKVLIVEDDFVSRLILEKLLSPSAECHIAVNGNEAYKLFIEAFNSGKPFDLICLDIMMPELDGRDTLKLIRETEKKMKVHPRDEVKIIMITALDTPDEVIDSYYKGGCNSYLVKPIVKNKLFDAINQLF